MNIIWVEGHIRLKAALHTFVFYRHASLFFFIACTFVFFLFFASGFLPQAQAEINKADRAYLVQHTHPFTSYDGDSRTLTGDAATQHACSLLQLQASQALRAHLTGPLDNQAPFAGVSDATLRSWVFKQGQTTLYQTLDSALNASCSALGGQNITTKMSTLLDAEQITSIVSAAAFNAGIARFKTAACRLRPDLKSVAPLSAAARQTGKF
jgi:hypothetical protein